MFTYIYIDESGNLDMKNSKEKYFVVSALKIPNDKELIKVKRILKKIRQRKLKKKLKELPELKFSNSNKIIKKLILTKLSKLNVETYTIIINKKFTKTQLKDNIPILYNYIIKILLEKTLNNLKNKNLNIILDRCMNEYQRNNFENYIKTEFLELFSTLPNLNIEHFNSENIQGLQLVDFVAGAFRQKYNFNNEEYTKLIENINVIEKNDLFKKK